MGTRPYKIADRVMTLLQNDTALNTMRISTFNAGAANHAGAAFRIASDIGKVLHHGND